MIEPVAYFYASIAGPVVLHRLKQIGVAKPLFNQRQVDDDLKAADDWPKAHSMIPLYTKPEWQELTESEMGQFIHDHCQPSKTYRSLLDFATVLSNCLKRKNT